MKKEYLLTYDVHNDHERIIQDLIRNNWHSVKQGFSNGKHVICYLPETTWWKEFNNSQEAFDEFKRIAGAYNIVRQAVTVFSEWIITTKNPLIHQKEEARMLNLIEN